REGRSEPTSIELRMVVLENIETGKRIAIYTNNKEKPLSDIAYSEITVNSNFST
ncbi:MAG: hypothetical protein AEth_00678, partial [Candidatus Argoarchaeum ethanivorans]